MTIRPAVKAIATGIMATALSGTALAQSVNSNLSVKATVTATCTATTEEVAFGNVNTLSATAHTATGKLNVTCTNGSAWTAAASAGSGTGASHAIRKMASGSNFLNYSLFTDSGHSAIWGDGAGSTSTIGGTGTGAVQGTTIYGRVLGSQTSVPAGSYADTIAVTISF